MRGSIILRILSFQSWWCLNVIVRHAFDNLCRSKLLLLLIWVMWLLPLTSLTLRQTLCWMSQLRVWRLPERQSARLHVMSFGGLKLLTLFSHGNHSSLEVCKHSNFALRIWNTLLVCWLSNAATVRDPNFVFLSFDFSFSYHFFPIFDPFFKRLNFLQPLIQLLLLLFD